MYFPISRSLPARPDNIFRDDSGTLLNADYTVRCPHLNFSLLNRYSIWRMIVSFLEQLGRLYKPVTSNHNKLSTANGFITSFTFLLT